MKKSLLRKTFAFLYFFTAFFFLFTTDVNAYIDPSVMTYAIQAVAGIAIALGAVIGVYGRKLRNLVFKNRADPNLDHESDNLEFRDPAAGEVRTLRYETPGKTAAKETASSDYTAGLLLSIAMGFMLCFYTPLEIYFTNIFEFEYDIYAIFRYILLLFVLVALAMAAGYYVIYRISKKVYFGCVVLGLIAFTAFYIQGNFLVGNLPPSDGSEIDWSLYRSEEIKSLVLWIAVTLIVIALAVLLKRRKFLNLTRVFTAGITAVLAVTLITLAVNNNGLQRKTQLCVSHDALNRMSSDRNFILLVIDAADSKTFQDLMLTEDPDFREVFEDFTYYPDTLAAYPFTLLAVPQILTGEWYVCQDEFRAYNTKAMKNSPLLNRLKEENYARGFYDVQGVQFEDAESLGFENVSQRPYLLGSVKTFLMDELRMAFFLYMPFQLKKYEPYALFNLLNQKAADYYFEWYDPWFYDYFEEHEIEVQPEKCFRYIHIEGAHPPMRYDKHLNDVEGTDKASYAANMEACVTTLARYLRALKESGTYDNSAIVILGDHGYADRVHSTGRQNPLLLIKGVGESHPLETSNAALTYDSLQDIYGNLLDEKTGTAVLDGIPDSSKSRRYIMYEYDNANYLEELQLQDAHASESSELRSTGTVYQR